MIDEIVARLTEVEDLCRRFGVQRLEVFGSAVGSSFRDGESDLDFLVEFDADARGVGYSDRFFGLLEALEDLFGRQVDLIVASAIKNPFFRESVERSKALVYAA